MTSSGYSEKYLKACNERADRNFTLKKYSMEKNLKK